MTARAHYSNVLLAPQRPSHLNLFHVSTLVSPRFVSSSFSDALPLHMYACACELSLLLSLVSSPLATLWSSYIYIFGLDSW